MLRGYVRHWLGNVWGEFDRIKLTDIVGKERKDGQRRQENLKSRPAIPRLGLDSSVENLA